MSEQWPRYTHLPDDDCEIGYSEGQVCPDFRRLTAEVAIGVAVVEELETRWEVLVDYCEKLEDRLVKLRERHNRFVQIASESAAFRDGLISDLEKRLSNEISPTGDGANGHGRNNL